MILLDKSGKTEAEWEKLNRETYYILRKELNALFKMNLMTTMGHYFLQPKLPLFDSETKFNSGTDGLVFMPFKQQS
jgi:peptide methionine sulfoxide reductase MsrB